MSGLGDTTLTGDTGSDETTCTRGNGNDTGTGQDNRRANNNTAKNRRKDKNCRGKGRGKIETDFRGESTDMNGHAFQTNAEQSKQVKLQGTLNMLNVYVFIVFKEDISYLTPMFTELKELEVPKPADPVEI